MSRRIVATSSTLYELVERRNPDAALWAVEREAFRWPDGVTAAEVGEAQFVQLLRVFFADRRQIQ